jgi:hypothetical protein
MLTTLGPEDIGFALVTAKKADPNPSRTAPS